MKNILPVALVLLGAASLLSCSKEQTFVAPLPLGTEYYPLAVGRYWVYAVTDSVWAPSGASQTGTLAVSQFQMRERVESTYQDAAGQPAFRVVRSKRMGAAWVDDSIFSVSATAQAVVVSRGNRKTVELIFPVRENRLWNANAFGNDRNDTISAENRRYRAVGQPYIGVGGGLPNASAASLTTTDEGEAYANDQLTVRNRTQVYVTGIGPVFRRRRSFANYYYTNPNGDNIFVPGSYFNGFSRHEVLIEVGP